MRRPPSLAAASDRLPSREGPRGQTERSHLARVGGPNTRSSRVGEAEAQAKRPCSKRAGSRGGSGASLRGIRRRRQDMENNGPTGEGRDDPQAARLTARTPLQVEDKHALEQTSPAPLRGAFEGWYGSLPCSTRLAPNSIPLGIGYLHLQAVSSAFGEGDSGTTRTKI
jgi:hypothetical protein